MKRFMISFFIFVFAFLSYNAAAVASTVPAPEATPTVDGGQVFSPEQKGEAKESLKELGEMFGVTTPTEKEPPQQTPTTVVGIADKALDMIGNLVGTIAKVVEGVAPEVWEIMVRQQYAKGISLLVVPWGLFLLSIVYMGVIRIFWKKYPDGDDFSEDGSITDKGWRGFIATLLPLIILFLDTIWALSRTADAVLMLINPKYYAVQDLLRMLLQ
ncbi:MAG: hypothetical protein WC310_02135 [Patescibacteria group bacterium]|jgi:hypothetical protein